MMTASVPQPTTHTSAPATPKNQSPGMFSAGVQPSAATPTRHAMRPTHW